MAKNKVYVTVFLALLTGFAVLAGCAGEGAGAGPREGFNSEPDENTPFVFKPSLPQGYRYYPVTIHFTNAESLQFRTYTTKDFPEINCVNIYYQSEGVMEVAQAQYDAEKTGDWGRLEDRVNMGMLMNLEIYTRIIDMIVLEASKESLARGIDLLTQRNDIQHVSYPYWAEPGFKPVYGAFKDRGLDVETEKQILQDWVYWDYRDKHHQWFLTSAEAHSIEYYGGTYNGSAVINIAHNDLGMPFRYSVAGMFLVSPFFIHVWNNGSFYGLNEAYDLGLLTENNIKGLPDPLYINPDHLCDYYHGKIPTCTFAGCTW